MHLPFLDTDIDVFTIIIKKRHQFQHAETRDSCILYGSTDCFSSCYVYILINRELYNALKV